MAVYEFSALCYTVGTLPLNFFFMLPDDIHTTVESIFQEVLARRRQEGAFGEEAYDQFVDDILQEKMDKGELSDDDDVQEWKEQLQNRWPEVEQMDAEKEDGGKI